jgi:serine protease Do
VITSLNGKPISSFAALRAEVGSMPIGSKVQLGLVRDGKPVNVSLNCSRAARIRLIPAPSSAVLKVRK